mmetsp:Transcript_43091/g.99822  ORF Transcript_43091/g.99822 Transcript_43091/m.99822 type:complete len:280 (+) Transcript_43091:157-996(+)
MRRRADEQTPAPAPCVHGPQGPQPQCPQPPCPHLQCPRPRLEVRAPHLTPAKSHRTLLLRARHFLRTNDFLALCLAPSTRVSAPPLPVRDGKQGSWARVALPRRSSRVRTQALHTQSQSLPTRIPTPDSLTVRVWRSFGAAQRRGLKTQLPDFESPGEPWLSEMPVQARPSPLVHTPTPSAHPRLRPVCPHYLPPLTVYPHCLLLCHPRLPAAWWRPTRPQPHRQPPPLLRCCHPPPQPASQSESSPTKLEPQQQSHCPQPQCPPSQCPHPQCPRAASA